MLITKRPAVLVLVLSACAFAAGCGGKKKQKGGGAGGGTGGSAGGGSAGSAGNGEPTAGGVDLPVAAARGPEHAVFNLTDNRLLAHQHANGGLLINAASPGLAKYLHMGKPRNWWAKGETVDGQAAVRIDNYAPLELPLDDSEAAGKTIWVRMKGEGAGRNVTLEIGGKSVTLPVPEAWTTMAFALPDGALKSGENVMRLIYTKGAAPAVAWVQVGGSAAPAGDVAPALYDPKDGGGLLLAQGATLSWYVQVPKGGLLAGDVPVAGVGSSRVDLQACKLEYSIVSPK